MTASADRDRAHALVDELFGPTDPAADRAVDILHAHAAALTWVREIIGSYPAPPSVAAHLARTAEGLRADAEHGEPAAVLHEAAVEALAAYRATSAAWAATSSMTSR